MGKVKDLTGKKFGRLTVIEQHGWEEHLTLERINVNGNYEPSNCEWIPMSEQYKNKQSNHNKMPLPEPYKAEREK